MCDFRTVFTYAIMFLYILDFNIIHCDKQIGPDPWHNVVTKQIQDQLQDHIPVPADLKFTPNPKAKSYHFGGLGEGFFRRMLAILSKGGQVVHNEDDSIEVSLNFRFDPEKWKVLNEYLKSSGPFTEEMYRRSMGYVQDAMYKPSLSEKIVIAWADYVQIYLVEYKMHISWSLGILAMTIGVFWCWRHMSQKHMVISAFLVTYLYEGFVSYKEAEQQEIKKFLNAIDSCKFFFWSSTCEVPPPDPLIFLKHMNPLKIAIRMFTSIICEPMIAISETIKVMMHGITDGLWFPFDKIAYIISIITLNMVLVFLLIMIVFNYILNIPFNFSIFGLFNLGIKQRKRNFIDNTTPISVNQVVGGDGDKISAVTLDKILDFCSKALDSSKNNLPQQTPSLFLNNNIPSNVPSIKRSASTGRLSDYVQSNNTLQNNIKKRYQGRKKQKEL